MALAGQDVVSAVTATNPRAVKVKTASTPVLAANANRNGLNLLNDSPNNIYFSLEGTAVLDKDFVLYPAGAWDGIISGALWIGSVTAIAASESNLLVAEV
jgi:hypothetical protein